MKPNEPPIGQGDTIREIATGRIGVIQSARYKPQSTTERTHWCALTESREMFEIPIPVDPAQYELVERKKKQRDSWVEMNERRRRS